MSWSIRQETEPDEEAIRVVEEGLERFNREAMGGVRTTEFHIFARTAEGRVIGGSLGNHGARNCYVRLLWVDPSHRGQGVGSGLMRSTEELAAREGCVCVYLNTLSFQAPEFYEKLGYTSFAEIEILPEPHRRIWYRKDLAQEAG